MVTHEVDGRHAAGDRKQDPAARFRRLLPMPRYYRMREFSSLDDEVILSVQL